MVLFYKGNKIYFSDIIGLVTRNLLKTFSTGFKSILKRVFEMLCTVSYHLYNLKNVKNMEECYF